MGRAQGVPRGRSAAVFAGALLLASGCSYLKWARGQSEERSELTKHPGDLRLEKEYAPQDCFGLEGTLEVPKSIKDPLLIGAFDHEGTDHALVGFREVIAATGAYGILLPAGSYDVLVFADLDRDGFYRTDEVVGSTSPGRPVAVGTAQSADGVLVPGPQIPIDPENPRRADSAVAVKVARRPFVVESVDDPLFDPALGEMGVYRPNQFLSRTQGWIFAVGEPDYSKAQVVLVHGIEGTPRDFGAIVSALPHSRYQLWLFYYPSGLGLDKLGIVLARVVSAVAERSGSPELRLAVVAHSMGGLVGRRAVNELCKSGRPPYLKLYASFDTPYGGIEAVVGAERRGQALIPSWKDIASDSDFLKRLHASPLPEDLPFHLFFGWGTGVSHGPRPAGDGTIRLPSQLDPRAQNAATKMTGFGETHVGILSDRAAIAALEASLDAATSSGAP